MKIRILLFLLCIAGLQALDSMKISRENQEQQENTIAEIIKHLNTKFQMEERGYVPDDISNIVQTDVGFNFDSIFNNKINQDKLIHYIEVQPNTGNLEKDVIIKQRYVTAYENPSLKYSILRKKSSNPKINERDNGKNTNQTSYDINNERNDQRSNETKEKDFNEDILEFRIKDFLGYLNSSEYRNYTRREFRSYPELQNITLEQGMINATELNFKTFVDTLKLRKNIQSDDLRKQVDDKKNLTFPIRRRTISQSYQFYYNFFENQTTFMDKKSQPLNLDTDFDNNDFLNIKEINKLFDGQNKDLILYIDELFKRYSNPNEYDSNQGNQQEQIRNREREEQNYADFYRNKFMEQYKEMDQDDFIQINKHSSKDHTDHQQNKDMDRTYKEYYNSYKKDIEKFQKETNREIKRTQLPISISNMSQKDLLSITNTLTKIWELQNIQPVQKNQQNEYNTSWKRLNATQFEQDYRNLTILADQGVTYFYDISGDYNPNIISVKQQVGINYQQKQFNQIQSNYNLVLSYERKSQGQTDIQYFLTTIYIDGQLGLGQIISVDRLQPEDFEKY